MAMHNNNELKSEIVNLPLPRDQGGHSGLEGLHLGVLEDMVGYQLRRAQLRVSHSFSKQLEAANVTPGQLILLIKIKNNAGISQTCLAKANGIERSTLGEIIDRFEKRRWVDRRKHASDRRAYALHLTPQGEILISRLVPMALAHEAELMASWSEEDKRNLLRLLGKLADT